ncbi:MAG TPA: hypothetical protein DF383_01065 [Deltaproteobacteria bacterium]|nr:hypothetical protein [Deltaproteobacteria bacterium]
MDNPQFQTRKQKIVLPPDFDRAKYETQGVDIDALIANLNRTPTERVENNRKIVEAIRDILQNKKSD